MMKTKVLDVDCLGGANSTIGPASTKLIRLGILESMTSSHSSFIVSIIGVVHDMTGYLSHVIMDYKSFQC